jgi:formylglycine-generating enzyme required for sulfatase activity
MRKKYTVRGFGLVLTISLLTGAATQAAVIRVPQDQPIIQAGLDSAVPGDTVLVSPGTYYENLLWPAVPSVTLYGAGTPEVVIIDGGRQGRVVTIDSEDSHPAVIGWVTLQRGKHGLMGGGVYAELSDLVLIDCVVQQNIAEDVGGGGIYAESNTLWLSGSVITDNRVGFHPDFGDGYLGGGICAENVVAVDCVISNNVLYGSHSDGAGIVADNIDITNCLIVSNNASNIGGIAYAGGVVSRSTVVDNEWYDYGTYWGENKLVFNSCILGRLRNETAVSTELNYTCYGDVYGSVDLGPGCFSADPLFAEGPQGGYYLSQTSAGQGLTSRCVDAGDPEYPSEGTGTTRTDHVPDTGRLDMGYHYESDFPTPTPTPTATPTVTPEPTDTPEPTATPQDFVRLELILPCPVFDPGSLFRLDLDLVNTGPSLFNARLFVALTIGSGDFWFYPDWDRYPPGIEWMTVGIPGSSADTWSIIPQFPWPDGAGSFDGAMFLAAILHENLLVSNLAEISFSWTDEPLPTATPTPMPTATPTVPPVPDGYVYIRPGTYTRGSPESEPCRHYNEGPLNQVTLTRGFFMMETEVMRGMWADLRAVQPGLPEDPSDSAISPTGDHPVDKASWYEAVLFANLKSLQEGFRRCYYVDEDFSIPIDASNYIEDAVFCDFSASGYRLPTDAEWEYAARAGTTGPFSCEDLNYRWGNCYGSTCIPGSLPVLELYAVTCANNPGGTAVVGSKFPNPWGIYDMHGNVWEWCWDRNAGSHPKEPVTDPEGPDTGLYRTMRGGGWGRFADDSRSARRQGRSPNDRQFSQGFRLVRIFY